MPAEDTDWTATYLEVRRREGRLYPDAIVATLPVVPQADVHHAEWRLRADSARRLVAYLARQPELHVVEIGCGNGWLSNQIATIPGSRVVGIDRNSLELEQARRVFGSRPNLTFVAGDVTDRPAEIEGTTTIVLASVIQYVDDLSGLLRELLSAVAPGGEIHILDSPIYRGADVAAAAARSRRYYAELGVPEMAALYHHHTWDELDPLAPHVMYSPASPIHEIERRLGRPRSPFPWVRILNR